MSVPVIGFNHESGHSRNAANTPGTVARLLAAGWLLGLGTPNERLVVATGLQRAIG
jgi:hypothetical protein